MKFLSYILLFTLLFASSCTKEKKFVLSFGSCNNQHINNPLWSPIESNSPDVFVWGGDIIYSDTEDMNFMKENYTKQNNDSSYLAFKKKVRVIGTWDDHDYGLNDGGSNYTQKDSTQQLFLDFFDIPIDDPRRKREGIYMAEEFIIGKSSINMIILDTRYFRSDLIKDPTGIKRYIPDHTGNPTMLGANQWKWLEKTLNESNSQFNVIVSSIQFLSKEHGFECWANMPKEVEKMIKLIVNSKAKGVVILSGDRHIAEISQKEVKGLEYPLIDFTSSGMTHSYETFKSEPNEYRVTDVVADKNFGLLHFDLEANTIKMEIRGEQNQLFESIDVNY